MRLRICFGKAIIIDEPVRLVRVGEGGGEHVEEEAVLLPRDGGGPHLLRAVGAELCGVLQGGGGVGGGRRGSGVPVVLPGDGMVPRRRRRRRVAVGMRGRGQGLERNRVLEAVVADGRLGVTDAQEEEVGAGVSAGGGDGLSQIGAGRC